MAYHTLRCFHRASLQFSWTGFGVISRRGFNLIMQFRTWLKCTLTVCPDRLKSVCRVTFFLWWDRIDKNMQTCSTILTCLEGRRPPTFSSRKHNRLKQWMGILRLFLHIASLIPTTYRRWPIWYGIWSWGYNACF